MAVCILTLFGVSSAPAHTHGATSIHEISSSVAPSAKLLVTKDPTGGFNVQVQTSRFTWRPDMASMKHIEGEGHAHVYLDGRKIMRIYNNWFHLNTFQFATKSGEQLVSIELVGNDHAPYTTEGLPVGAEALVDVAADEIRPKRSEPWKLIAVGATAVSLITLSLLALRISRRHRSQG
jgi:hypothetical protein